MSGKTVSLKKYEALIDCYNVLQDELNHFKEQTQRLLKKAQMTHNEFQEIKVELEIIRSRFADVNEDRNTTQESLNKALSEIDTLKNILDTYRFIILDIGKNVEQKK